MAARSRSTELLKFVLENRNVDLKAKDTRGQTALDVCESNNLNEMVEIIIHKLKK